MDTQSEKNNVQKETEVAASGAKTHRKRNLVIVTLLFLIIAAGFALAYFLFWQHEEETEDAYVAGHLVMITPQTIRPSIVNCPNGSTVYLIGVAAYHNPLS